MPERSVASRRGRGDGRTGGQKWTSKLPLRSDASVSSSGGASGSGVAWATEAEAAPEADVEAWADAETWAEAQASETPGDCDPEWRDDDQPERDAEEPFSMLRIAPELPEMRAQVTRGLLDASRYRSRAEVQRENARMALELRRAVAELDDVEVEATLAEEAGRWRADEARLREAFAELCATFDGAEAQVRRREAEARRVEQAEAEELSAEIRAEVLLSEKAASEIAEMRREKERCDRDMAEAEKNVSALRKRLDQQRALGLGSGTALLFVAALPALDASDAGAVSRVREALDAQLQSRRLRG